MWSATPSSITLPFICYCVSNAWWAIAAARLHCEGVGQRVRFAIGSPLHCNTGGETIVGGWAMPAAAVVPEAA
eukprot:6224383-Pyramimonas_sp.AAC.1